VRRDVRRAKDGAAVIEPGDMVMRVARAIRKARLKFQGAAPILLAFTDDAPAEEVDIEHARAAIEAMREPTPEMLRAAQTTHASYLRAATDAEIWQAMIRAALSSPRVSDNSALGED
jgi:hypothetical protein